MTIYLLRHGETEWNIARRCQGAADSPLTARGHEQALRNAALMARLLNGSAGSFRLVSSPQKRAFDTATYVSRALGLEVETDPRLREVSLGAWEGMTYAEIERDYPHLLAGTGRDDWFFQAPEGEGFEAARSRVAEWMDSASPPLIVVSHGLTTRFLRGLYAGLDRPSMLSLPIPQDGVFRLAEGRMEFLPAD